MGPVSQPLLAPPTLTFVLGDRSILLAYGLAPLVVWSSRETADTPRKSSSSWVVGKSLWKEGHPHIEPEMPFLVYPLALREDRLCCRGGVALPGAALWSSLPWGHLLPSGSVTRWSSPAPTRQRGPGQRLQAPQRITGSPDLPLLL